MSTEIAVLRALLRLARRRAPATLTDLLDRVGSDAGDVQRALASLARAQLVQRSGDTARLSLAGLAVAVAAASSARPVAARAAAQSRSAANVARRRVLPMTRRHRAA